MISMPAFLDRLTWDPETGGIHDGDIRYMLIRPDALMGLFRNLPEDLRQSALDAFRDSIHEHGGRSARTYQARGAGKSTQLLAVIEATAPQLGWGIWHFTAKEKAALNLEVHNSPFVAGHGPAADPVCAPIVGMLRAVSELALGATVTVMETRCAAVADGTCHFRAEMATNSS